MIAKSLAAPDFLGSGGGAGGPPPETNGSTVAEGGGMCGSAGFGAGAGGGVVSVGVSDMCYTFGYNNCAIYLYHLWSRSARDIVYYYV